MAGIRKWSWKIWLPMKALNLYRSVLMISCSNNKVMRYQAPAWDGNWKEAIWNDPNLLVVRWIWQSHNIVLTKCGELQGVRDSFVQNPQWHLLLLGSTRIFESKMLRKGDCWLSELRCVDWMSVGSKQNVSPGKPNGRCKAWLTSVCYVLCQLLTAVSWPWTVHGRHRNWWNCGTGMAGQKSKGRLQAALFVSCNHSCCPIRSQKKKALNTMQVEQRSFQQCILGFQTSVEPSKPWKLMGRFL